VDISFFRFEKDVRRQFDSGRRTEEVRQEKVIRPKIQFNFNVLLESDSADQEDG